MGQGTAAGPTFPPCARRWVRSIVLHRTAMEGTTRSSHEQLEHAEHAEHASHSNKKIALVIALLALGLAFSETLGKSAHTTARTDNIKSPDTWAFFQAKTIRQTSLRTAAEAMMAVAPGMSNDEAKAAMTKQ